MKKTVAVFISIGVILVIVGLVMVGIFGRDKLKDFSIKDIVNGLNHDLSQADVFIDKQPEEYNGVQAVSIKVKRYSAYVLPSKNDTLSVQYVDPDDDDVKINVSYNKTTHTLNVTQDDDFTSWWLFNGYRRKGFIAVYLPQTEIFAEASLEVDAKTSNIKVQNVGVNYLKASTRTGAVTLDKVNAGKIEVTTNTGTVSADGVTCNDIYVRTDTGSVNVSDTAVAKTLDIDVDTGSVRCDVTAVALKIKTDTGSVIFTTNAANIDIDTDTGSVNGTVLGKKSEYQITVKKNTGSSNLDNQYVQNANKFLKIEVDTGSINIDFDD